MNGNRQLVVIGGGPAGLAAAIEANKAGLPAENILILERDREAGGILNQCIHAGFGLHHFGEELTGPEYAARFLEEAKARNIPCLTNAMALSLSEDRTVTFVSPTEGLSRVSADAVILAMGCRERTRGALNIAGTRPAGIFTAGTAQRLVNIDGYLPGRKVVILGSGDIGLIMARRMTLEGATVLRVCELMPYSGGLPRNLAQCLDDFQIPLYLSHTVVSISGKERVEGVTIAEVDEKRRPIPGTEEYVPCDTLLLSVGLLPENELTREAGITLDPVTGGAVVDETMQTSLPGIFACGNVLHVHDLVDYVTEEAGRAGRSAAQFVLNGLDGTARKTIPVKAVCGVRYVMPQLIHTDAEAPLTLFFRVDNNYRDKVLTVSADGEPVYQVKKRILVPGQMENVVLRSNVLDRIKNASSVSVSLSDPDGKEGSR